MSMNEYQWISAFADFEGYFDFCPCDESFFRVPPADGLDFRGLNPTGILASKDHPTGTSEHSNNQNVGRFKCLLRIPTPLERPFRNNLNSDSEST